MCSTVNDTTTHVGQAQAGIPASMAISPNLAEGAKCILVC